MKKFLVVTLAALGLSSVSSAATILCTADDGTANIIQNNIANPQPATYTCQGAIATPGFQITGVALGILASFNDEVQTDINQLHVLGTSSLGATQDTLTNADILSGDNSGTIFGSNIALPPSAFIASGSKVSIFWDFNGQQAPTNATVVVGLRTQETALPPPPGVPEPSTFVLLGSALTGLGVLARRRKA